MDITERAEELAAKIRHHKSAIETEEATKTAFVMPFISGVLGYDVFNPAEVIPEYTTDVGTKKGEKIDYAIVRDGEVRILIEAKKITEQLKFEHASQLFRYFGTTNSRIAILTNGEVYEFYTDLDSPNRMDSKPFLVFNFSDIDETLLPELAKLAKDSFNLESVLSAAGELKYVGQIKRVLATQFKNPDGDWVKSLTTRIYDGNFTQRVREQFGPLVEKAMRQFLNEQVNDRLKNALNESIPMDAPPSADDSADPAVSGDLEPADESGGLDVVTTDEELEGYRIVRAIVCSDISASRVVYRDGKTYFGILLDDNNRKPIARLWLNRSRKYLGLFDANKTEMRVPIETNEQIYEHAEKLRATVRRYASEQISLTAAPALRVVGQGAAAEMPSTA